MFDKNQLLAFSGNNADRCSVMFPATKKIRSLGTDVAGMPKRGKQWIDSRALD